MNLHSTFRDGSQETICAEVKNIPESRRCHFVRTTEDCLNNMYLINYLSWHYCLIDTRNALNVFWSALAMTLVCIYVFWMFQVAVTQYFCPTLKVIADNLKLNENTAGVTLLSIANGSPDIFTALAGMMTLNKFSFLVCVSQIMFLHNFVGGLVTLIRPFDVETNYFLRDFAFLFLNTTYLDFIHKNRPILSAWEAIAGLCIYIIYVLVAIFDQRLIESRLKMLERSYSISSEQDHKLEKLLALKSLTQLPLNRILVDRSRPHSGNRNSNLFRQFWQSICKFDSERFRRSNTLMKVFLIIKEPMEMILRLSIPVVNVEKPNHDWSKLLCCLQFVAAPTYIAFILLRGITIWGIAVYILAFYILIPLGIIIFLTTRTDTLPKYFKYMSYMGFIASIFLIFAISCEALAMFFAIGTIMGLSQQFIIATAMCWSLSCGDLVSSIAFARQGLPRMAHTATFSSPVFGTFVNLFMPLAMEIVFHSDSDAIAEEGSYGEFTCIFAEVGMCFSLVAILTSNFKMRTACGALRVVYYLVFILALVLLEHNLVQSYGVDGHR